MNTHVRLLKTTIFVVAILFQPFSARTQNNTIPSVEIDNVPQSIEAFTEMRNNIATTPQGGAAMFILALKIYTENPELGEKCLIVMVDKGVRRENPNGYKGYTLLNTDMNLIRRQLAKQQYIPKSYISGATPDNAYEVNLPYMFKFSVNRYSGTVESGNIKLFVACSGASTPRPIRMKINSSGIWKASEWSSLVVGIRKPTNEDIDDL